MSTNHCARTSCWWVRACAPHLWFVHLLNWHFSLHLPPLQHPSICTVDNLQRLRFGSLPKSSQERVKHESTFTFTFTLRTIYEVNGTARYIERWWPATDNDAILTLYLIHTLSLTLSAFYRASNQLIHLTIEQSNHWSIDSSINTLIDQSIHQSIHQLIDPSIHRYINPSIHQSKDTSIHRSFVRSIHPSIDPSIHPLIIQSIYPSIDWSIHRSINKCIDRYIHPSINPSNHPSIDTPIDTPINQSIDRIIPLLHGTDRKSVV